MAIPTTHQSLLLAALGTAEGLAYAMLDTMLRVDFADPAAARYGIVPGTPLGAGPAWLAALAPRLEQLFAEPRHWLHTTQDNEGRPVSLLAAIVEESDMPRLLLILRRPPGGVTVSPHDPLTGLHSAAFMEGRIEEELERLKRYPGTFSLLSVTPQGPLDEAGLLALTDLMRLHFRAVDVVGHGREGNLLVLLPGLAAAEARLAGQRLETLLEERLRHLTPAMSLRYTVIQARAKDTRNGLLRRLAELERA